MEKVVGTPPSFLGLLEEVYQDEAFKRTQEAAREIRHNPSSASVVRPDGTVVGACLRQLFYKAKGIPGKETELTGYLIADFGNAIHEKLQDRLQKSNRIRLVPEAKGKVAVDGLTKEVSYRLDGLVTYHGELGCLEIKTMNSYMLNRMVKELHAPRDQDILQVMSYFGTNPDLLWASLLYVGRDTAFRAEFHIIKQLDGSFTVRGVVPKIEEKKIEGLGYEEIVKRWKALEGYLEADQVPPRDYKVVLDKEGKVTPKRTKNHVDYKSDSRCLNCSWVDLCWTGADAVEDAYKIGG